MTKPRFDHRIKRTFAYRSAEETLAPGYLGARFRAMRSMQVRAARGETENTVEAARKVRTLPKRRSA